MKENGKFRLLKLVCVIGALATTIWCCYEFIKNEDMCEIYFKRFAEDEESIYPDLSIIIPHQLDETALQREYGNAVNPVIFTQNLIGERQDHHIWNISMEKKIEIHQVSKGIEDYLISTCNLSPLDYTSCTSITNISTLHMYGGILHSFSFPIKERVTHAIFRINTSVFYDNVSPGSNGMLVALHYPNQVFRSQGSFFLENWNRGGNDLSKMYYKIQYKIKSMEILRRRHKIGQDCLDLVDYDGQKREELYIEQRCRPFYLKSIKVDKVCTKKEEIKNLMWKQRQLFYRLKPPKNDIPPCREITKLQIDKSVGYISAKEVEMNNMSQPLSWFEIDVDILTDTFKVIRQKRVYSQQSLIGNVGGYVGILIGFSLSDLLSWMIKQFPKK